MENKDVRKKFNFANVKIPHTYVLIFAIIIIAAILTYIVPAGEYDRYKNEKDITVIDPESYHRVEQSPTGFLDIFDSVTSGMKAAAGIIFFVFIVGGSFQIITGTGAIDIGIGKIVKAMNGREKLLIPILCFTFSLGGAFMGMSNESLIFVPIGIALARKVGFDALVGTAMVTVSMAGGFAAGIMNPFNIGIAQGIAELPMFSGVGYRVLIHIVLLTVLSLYLMRYADKVKKDPSKSIVHELEKEEASNVNDIDINDNMQLKHYLTLITVFVGFAYLIYGVFKYEWGTDEMATVFLAMGVIGGLLGGLKPSNIGKEFVSGAKALTFGALVIGLSRGILIVLQDGMILDTIVRSFSSFLGKLPPQLTAAGMYFIHAILNFLIPSGSGQAAATMPLMIPMGDLTGVTRQIAVLAFALSDGITNSINPTSSNMNSYLSLSKITYPQWLKFIGPIIGMWFLIGLAFVLVGNVFGYGPF